HRHRLRAVRPALHRVHGRHRRGAAAAQRVPHEAARRRSGARHLRRGHAQGRDERGHAPLGGERGRHLLLHRHRRRPAPVPGHGARLPERHRRGSARADAGGRGAPAGRAGGGHRRRLQRHGAVLPLPRRLRRADVRRRGGGARPRQRRARGVPEPRPPRCAARQPHLPVAGRARSDRRGALHLRRPRLPRRRAGALLAARAGACGVRGRHGRRRAGSVQALLEAGRHHPGAGAGARAGARHAHGAGDAEGRADRDEPVRPRRQGHLHRGEPPGRGAV
ncbi:MAG: Tryptophan synthase beta chain, partial [uncultured Acetobacteraceae bacterium]